VCAQRKTFMKQRRGHIKQQQHTGQWQTAQSAVERLCDSFFLIRLVPPPPPPPHRYDPSSYMTAATATAVTTTATTITR
jgi:hypothetical protein